MSTRLDGSRAAPRAALIGDLDEDQLPLVRLPGGVELRAPSLGELARSLGMGGELAMT